MQLLNYCEDVTGRAGHRCAIIKFNGLCTFGCSDMCNPWIDVLCNFAGRVVVGSSAEPL